MGTYYCMFQRVPYVFLGKLEPPKTAGSYRERLLTKDLKVGMVVRNGRRAIYPGSVYTILETPTAGDKWLKVLVAYPGYKPREDTISLGDYSCQPYKSGVWNKKNWLREVK